MCVLSLKNMMGLRPLAFGMAWPGLARRIHRRKLWWGRRGTGKLSPVSPSSRCSLCASTGQARFGAALCGSDCLPQGEMVLVGAISSTEPSSKGLAAGVWFNGDDRQEAMPTGLARGVIESATASTLSWLAAASPQLLTPCLVY